MRTNFYKPLTWLTGPRLRKQLLTLASALLLAPAASAQTDIVVPSGNPNTAAGRRPLATWYGYERSAMIYTAGEIGASGTLTSIGFYLNGATRPGDAPTKVYLKTVSNASFAAATTVATELTGTTLVYDATVPAASFTPNTWITLPLSTPFVYDGTSNLEVIVETNATGSGNETTDGKLFRYSTTGTSYRAQFWWADTNPPTGVSRFLSVTRPNVRLMGLTPLACAPVSNVTFSNITPTSAQLAFTPGAANTSYTVSYFPTATPTSVTTVTPAPTASPVSLTGLTAGTAYTVNITGNCGASTTAPVFTTTFGTTTPGFTNDECANAVVVPLSSGCANPVIGTNVGATPSQGAPVPNTIFGCFPAGTATFVNNDVWFRMVVPTSGVVRVSTSAVTGSLLDDTGLTLYSGTCGTLTEVACNDDATGGLTRFSSATAAGLTPGSTLYARVWSAANAPTGQFGICAVEVPANDAAVAGVFTLGKVSAVNPLVPVQAAIRNFSGTAITNRVVTLTVSGATTYTATQTIASLAAGATTTVTFPPFPLTAATGTNTLTVSLPADDVASNNTGTYSQLITPNVLSYLDDSQPLSTQGLTLTGSGPNGMMAVGYTTAAATPLTGVRLHFPAGTVASTYEVLVFGATSTGRPSSNQLFASPTLTRPNAAGVVTVPVTGVTVNGAFFVAVRELSGPVRLGFQEESPLRASTFFSRNGTAATWTDISTTASTTRLGIEAVFNTTTSTRSAELARAINLYPNPAHGSFSLSLPALPGTRTAQLTLLNTLGQQVQTREVALSAAGTQTQVDVSGLAAGIYTLRVQAGNQLATKQVVVE